MQASSENFLGSDSTMGTTTDWRSAQVQTRLNGQCTVNDIARVARREKADILGRAQNENSGLQPSKI